MDKKAIVAGETLRVTCPVAGYPIESIVWEWDTRVLPINRKQKVFPNGTLIIENVERMSDQATYTCVARNAQGYSARGTLEVQVMGKFDASSLCAFRCRPFGIVNRARENSSFRRVTSSLNVRKTSFIEYVSRVGAAIKRRSNIYIYSPSTIRIAGCDEKDILIETNANRKREPA